ncbi:MAG: hypothetical protein A3B74_03675 [Candidatus Kerfeldbacteria bacterium RIFCSPHIGHO2_02_FULL_42_14]|uniref:Uncharacterized protein n=1 Tax=Candidatus Kerfeldbacteria bacterium RIFCSPHIGHO2_02_FULL_42_14 TaxID=1798540 RepID=A0A1G2APY9_9BACT|nr:MAG: hypothetical protein A3B74_03675 [Candidatus Kerfeldbacteria bacterium RIFCSPHIGHO2_02_FULL_42_14]OGY80617.1 MAG: hypothetical protein A3E60_04175 [Candidatus Kerfeldbacteria bacterium RIFCSPHIGHO2_12_FULL_42_13]OGY82541.1 MAG: hypothetical protein A3I91_03835 [Candidatus Kerfeldbacteria bacterium RIFCSPLOWO2_02_FULL_42_19]OGY85145.1 MAG: hypothetical protein A3G01_00965 [Candidatus Kerfeldbacteria bacterium RIFCSPLOWO2_12_FULL_43_9]
MPKRKIIKEKNQQTLTKTKYQIGLLPKVIVFVSVIIGLTSVFSTIAAALIGGRIPNTDAGILCSDSDGGADKYVPGFVRVEDRVRKIRTTYNDFCGGPKRVGERICTRGQEDTVLTHCKGNEECAWDGDEAFCAGQYVPGKDCKDTDPFNKRREKGQVGNPATGAYQEDTCRNGELVQYDCGLKGEVVVAEHARKCRANEACQNGICVEQ